MARYSKQSYEKMFDLLLSEELSFNSSYATKDNILMAIKKVLGRSLKMNCILLYSDLFIDSDLNVHFKIKDPDGDVISLTLYYGA